MLRVITSSTAKFRDFMVAGGGHKERRMMLATHHSRCSSPSYVAVVQWCRRRRDGRAGDERCESDAGSDGSGFAE